MFIKDILLADDQIQLNHFKINELYCELYMILSIVVFLFLRMIKNMNELYGFLSFEKPVRLSRYRPILQNATV